MPHFNKDDYEELAPMKVDDGDYPFAIINATETLSKAGNEMINLEIQVDVGAEKPMTVYDRLVFTTKALFRIKDFCDGVGLGEQWEGGMLDAEDCLGIEGTAHLVLGLENDKGKRYMEVGWYVKPKGFAETPAPASRLSPAAQKKLDKAREGIAAKAPTPATEKPVGVVPFDDENIPF